MRTARCRRLVLPSCDWRSDAPRDAGFTLVEILLVLMITGIILGAITTAILIGIKTVGGASSRLNDSTDRQVIEYYIPADAMSATTAYANVTKTSNPEACYTKATGSSSSIALMLLWNVIDGEGVPPTTSITPTEVDYVLSSSSTSGYDLLTRYLYSGSAATSCTLLSSKIVATSLTFTSSQCTLTGTPLSTQVSNRLITVTLCDASGQYVVLGQERAA